MRTQLYWFPLALALIPSGCAVSAHAAEASAAFSTTLAEFNWLSDTEKSTLVAKALEYRLKHSRNIYYESRSSITVNELRNGKVGKVLADGGGNNYKRWQLGLSYRVDTERSSPGAKVTSTFISDGLDAASGIARSIVQPTKHDAADAWIRMDHDNVMLGEDRYSLWLDGKHGSMGEHLIRYFVTYKRHFKIEQVANEENIRLSVPWRPVFSHEPIGTRTFVLNPARGFLPVRGSARWETKLPDGKLWWRGEAFVVDESRLVGDVWMPTKQREWITTDDLKQKTDRWHWTTNVWTTTVSKIAHGEVKLDQLEVKFPKGTKVEDSIRDITYVSSGEGQ